MKLKITMSETELKAFTAYLQSKNLSLNSIVRYRSDVEQFFKRAKKEAIQITKKDILNYLEYLKKKRALQNVSRKMHLISLNHYFTFLYQSEQITDNPCLFLKIRGTKKRSLHKTFTAQELQQLYDNYYQHYVRNFDDNHIKAHNRLHATISKKRNAVILSILLHQGTTTKELDTLLMEDLDLIKATIKIRGGKKSNERIIPLKAEQIGLLMHYQDKIRPQLVEYSTIESEKLFLPLPEYSKKTTNRENLMHIFKLLSEQVKKIEPKFLNFKQTRASVITLWLKTLGLRKTQYLAGHRYISSTENYLPNNLEDLSNDIAKFHPF